VLMLTRVPVGHQVTVDLVREGGPLSVDVQVGRRPRR
jgi:hypothetical protein